MLRHTRRILIIAAIIGAVLAAYPALGAGLDYVGLRIIIPLGQAPFMIGVDIGTHLSFGWAMASLFLAPDGKTLILGSTEVAIGGQESAGASLLRATIGISYFDLTATFPSIVFGGGISYRFSFADHLQLVASGEIIYPLALGPPMFSIGGGWIP
ncbi:MAG TPA: hypothetical protein ENH11_10160 [Candidatus Acetothermia bacterium]|nr:hypothetical protein [Candidatus Acetothermia bacterium]